MNKVDFDTFETDKIKEINTHTYEIKPKVNNDSNGAIPGAKHDLTEEEIKKLNIPARDEQNYPMPSEEEMREAGNFMLSLSLMASSLDGNLQALVWDLYIKMNNFLVKDTEGASIKLAMSLEGLKEYLTMANNPILTNKK
jgi:hypothetical protein